MQSIQPSVLPLAMQVQDSECAAPSEASSSAPSSPRVASNPVTQEFGNNDAGVSAAPRTSSKISSAFSQTLGSKSWDLRRFQFIAAFVSMATVGWHDACAGALLPYIQAHFNITYSIVSLLFVGQCVGYVAASFSNTYLSDHLGLGKVLALGALFQIFGYTLIVPSLPFPVFVVAYMFTGFGLALQDAQVNTFIASLPNASTRLGWLHAFYGLGALVSPLLATVFAENGIRYNYYYILLIGISVLNTAGIFGAFRLQRDPLEQTNKANDSQQSGAIPMAAIENANSQQHIEDSTPVIAGNEEIFESSSKKLKTILSKRITVVSSIFLVLYVGAEVSIGGWIVSYLIDHRSGGASAGYVSSGFFAGITIGRVLLIKVNSLVGEKNVIWLYTALCVGLELVVWLAPNLVANAVAVSLVGFFMGPFYPIVMSLMTKVLPRSLHAGAIGFAAALGQTGSAIFPFITGTMAQQLGVAVLHPILLVLFGMMSILWILMPAPQRRTD